MLGWIVRILFVIAGFVTSLFVARDALNFSIIQMVISVILFTLAVTIAAFWQELAQFLNSIITAGHSLAASTITSAILPCKGFNSRIGGTGLIDDFLAIFLQRFLVSFHHLSYKQL